MLLKQELDSLKHLLKESFNTLERPFHSRAQKYTAFSLIYLGGIVTGVFDMPTGLSIMTLGIIAKCEEIRPAGKKNSSKIPQSSAAPQPDR